MKTRICLLAIIALLIASCKKEDTASNKKVQYYTTVPAEVGNCLKTFKNTPGTLYAGLEGALAKMEGSSWKYIYESNGQKFPYSYITGVWVNPSNSKHILFGGAVNGTNRTLSVYETYNEGESITQSAIS